MPLVRIRLFGEPDVHVDGHPHSFDAPPRTWPLLCYLLLRRESDSNRQAVANTLWPDATEEDARANLRRHLHYVKRAMPALPAGSSWFEVTKTTIRWNPGVTYWLDVAEFELSSKTPKRREQAAALYRDDLFARCDDEWILYERDRLRNMQLSNLSALSATARDLGSIDAAIAYAAHLLALDPWREDTVRMLMELRAGNGDRAGALSEYDRLRARLREELDADPMDETTALYERIKAAKPHANARGEQTDSEIAGREGEMESLERCWRNALNGHADVVLIGGEAGTGKTTLLTWLSGRAGASGANVFTGAATRDRGSAFAEFADILRASRSLWEDRIPAESHAALAQLLPEIGQTNASSADDDGARLRLLNAVGDALEVACAKTPLLLCLEDLHWAGASTPSLIEHLARRLARKRVLIAGTFREEEVPPNHPLREFRRKCARTPFFTQIALSNLSEEDVRSVAVRAVGEVKTAEIFQALLQQSGGNPLMVQDLLFSFSSDGRLAAGEGLRAHIAARVASLTPLSASTAQAAAVLGSALDVELLEDLTGLGRRDVLEALNDLCARRVLRAGGPGTYAFSHQLFAQAAYETASPAQRRDAHARALLLLEAYYAGDPDGNAATLGYHAERGELFDEASRWYTVAARRAFAAYANAEASEFAERAVRFARDSNGRFEALCLAFDVAQRSADRKREHEIAAELRALSEGDATRRLGVLIRELKLADGTDDLEFYDARLRELELTAPDTPAWQAQLHWYRSLGAQRRSHYAQAVGELTQALQIFQSLHDREAELRAYILWSDIAINQGQDAQRVLEQAEQLGLQADDPEMRARIHLVECRLLLQKDARAAFEAARRMAAAAARCGHRRLAALAKLYEGAACAQMGEVQAARARLSEAREEFAAYHSRSDDVRAALWQNIAEMSVRNYAEALRIGLDALAAARESSLHEMEYHLTNNVAVCYQNLGDSDRARTLFAQAVEIGEEYELGGFRSNPLQNLGFLEYARGNYAQAVPFLEAALGWPLGDEERMTVQACLGVCLALTDDLARARALADDCVRLAGTGEIRRFQQEERYWILAQLLQMTGDRHAAARYARIAYAVLEERRRLIGDAAVRDAFTEGSSYAKIRAAVERDEWPVPEPAAV